MAGDMMDVQLRHHIAQRRDIHLVGLEQRGHGRGEMTALAHQLQRASRFVNDRSAQRRGGEQAPQFRIALVGEFTASTQLAGVAHINVEAGEGDEGIALAEVATMKVERRVNDAALFSI